jgi:aarF domain-containing kinase
MPVFIRKDSAGRAQLVLLDHGLYDKLTPNNRQSLCNLYKAIVLNHEDNMQKFSKALGVDGKYQLLYLQTMTELFL